MAVSNIGKWSAQASLDARGMQTGAQQTIDAAKRVQTSVGRTFDRISNTKLAPPKLAVGAMADEAKASIGSIASSVGAAWTAAMGSILFRAINFGVAQMQTSTNRLKLDVETGVATEQIRALVAELELARQSTIGVRTEWDRLWADANLGIERIISSAQNLGDMSLEDQIAFISTGGLMGATMPVQGATVQTSTADLVRNQQLKQLQEAVAFLQGQPNAIGATTLPEVMLGGIIPAADTSQANASRDQYLHGLARETAMLGMNLEERQRFLFQMQGATEQQLKEFDVLSQARNAAQANREALEFADSLEHTIAALRHGEEAARRMALAERGASSATIERIEALERERRALQQAQQEMDRIRQATQEARTPQQRFEDELRRIPAGLNRAQRGSQVEQALRRAGWSEQQSPLLGSLSAGSSEAASVIQGSMTPQVDRMASIAAFLESLVETSNASLRFWEQIAENTGPNGPLAPLGRMLAQ